MWLRQIWGDFQLRQRGSMNKWKGDVEKNNLASTFSKLSCLSGFQRPSLPNTHSSEEWIAFCDENGRKQGFPPSKLRGSVHTHTSRKVDQGAGLSTALKDSSKDPVWGVLEEESKPPRGQPSWAFCFKLLKLGLLFLLEACSQVPNVLALPLHQANYNSLHFILVLECISSLGLVFLDHPNFSFHSAYLTCC